MGGDFKQFWVGVDVSKGWFDAAACEEGALPQDWQGLAQKRFAASGEGAAAFAAWVRGFGGECRGIAAESTGIYSQDLGELLAAADASLPGLAIVNPRFVKGMAGSLGLRDKSDAIDARTIAVYAAWKRPAAATKKSEGQERLRALFDLRDVLIERHRALENRLESERDGACRKLLARLARAEKREVERLDAAMAEVIESDEQLCRDARLIATIPGVGRVNAAAILVQFGDLRTWRRGEVVARAGLYPTRLESGSSVRGKPRLAKGGGAALRAKLYMAAIHLLQKDHGFNGCALRLIAAGRPKMVALCAAMRKILLVARALVVSGKEFEAGHGAAKTAASALA